MMYTILNEVNMKALSTWVNPHTVHQPEQVPLIAKPAYDGDSLYPQVVEVDLVNFWDVYEIWLARKEWLAEKRRMGKR